MKWIAPTKFYTMTTYKGFQIDHLNRVFKNGKQVFPSRFVAWDTIEQAMTAIDASIIAGEMLAKFPNLSKIDLKGICELENGTERADQAERWTESEAEKQLNEHE